MEDDAPAGVPEWVVTYGDMMSLLLTFFIMLVSLSEVIADKKYRAVMEAIQRYIGYTTSPRAPLGKKFPLNSLVAKLESLGSFARDRRSFGGVRDEAPPGKQLRVFHTPQGTAVMMGDPVPFAPGKAVLSDAARKQVAAIAESLAGKPNKIEIVGNAFLGQTTADAPDTTLLSYLRAKAVLAELVGRGIPLERIRIQAAGDTHPLPRSREDPFQRQDRVEVLMVDKFTDHFQGRRETTQNAPPNATRLRVAGRPP